MTTQQVRETLNGTSVFGDFDQEESVANKFLVSVASAQQHYGLSDEEAQLALAGTNFDTSFLGR